eukprot:scaffold537582_cov28-Prasinocladus_malaysianus.AAC.1
MGKLLSTWQMGHKEGSKVKVILLHINPFVKALLTVKRITEKRKKQSKANGGIVRDKRGQHIAENWKKPSEAHGICKKPYLKGPIGGLSVMNEPQSQQVCLGCDSLDRTAAK